MPFDKNTFVADVNPGDRNLQIKDTSGNIKFTLNPYHIDNISQNNNLIRINLKSNKFRLLDFPNYIEAIAALTILQEKVDILVNYTPFTIDKEIENFVIDQIQQSGGGGSASTSKPIYQTGIPLTTSGDNQPTGVTLSKTPSGFSRMQVLVNGQGLAVGITSSNVDCYFSPNGTTIRNYENMQTGDELYFNGNFVGYDLAPTDKVVFIYEAND